MSSRLFLKRKQSIFFSARQIKILLWEMPIKSMLGLPIFYLMFELNQSIFPILCN